MGKEEKKPAPTRKDTTAYKNVVGGKLNLGAGSAPEFSKDKKKQKKKKLMEEFTRSKEEQQRKEQEAAQAKQAVDRRTQAEKNFEMAREASESRTIQKAIKQSHREKIEKFNEYLANLTEHYDIPRVGPG